MGILKKILPERIPSFGAIFYAMVPAKMFLPHYRMIAREVSTVANGTLLDIGTGPGILPLEIGKLLPAAKIIGMDLSEKMIKIAGKNKEKLGMTNVEFKVMDANTLEFNDNSLDMVISTGSLHHWKQPVKIIDEIYRCLKQGCEAWIYDGFSGASDADIDTCIAKRGGVFPPRGLARRILGIHGFSQEEYDTILTKMVAETKFKTCAFETRGIMMRLCLRK